MLSIRYSIRDISGETKEKQRLRVRNQFLSHGGSQSRKIVDVKVEASFAVWKVSGDVNHCSGKFSSGLHSIRHEDCSSRSISGDFCELYIKLFTVRLQGLWKNGGFSSQWFQVKSGRKIGTVSLESCSQILEQTKRIKNLIQFTGENKTLETISRTSIHKCIL